MPTETATATDSAETTYLDAIRAAMRDEMLADPDVFILGEDVGVFGGAFKVTKGLIDEFGPQRVVDTPIAESGFAGLAAGAALMGLRPIVEFQFADFISCAFDQIINVIARHHYRTGDAMPVVLRAPYAARLRAGAFHSQSVEAYFAHTPGLKIVAPSTPEDAYGLMRAAIRDNNPVLYLENRWLYRRVKMAGPPPAESVAIGKAKVVREGTRATIITYGPTLLHSLEAADELAREGVAVEVVDIRTLVPLDVATIAESVSKTSRAVVVHEDSRFFGFGAEIAATVAEECFWHLDRPVVRLGAKDVPIPASAVLEDAVVVQTPQIVEAVRRMATT